MLEGGYSHQSELPSASLGLVEADCPATPFSFCDLVAGQQEQILQPPHDKHARDGLGALRDMINYITVLSLVLV